MHSARGCPGWGPLQRRSHSYAALDVSQSMCSLLPSCRHTPTTSAHWRLVALLPLARGASSYQWPRWTSELAMGGASCMYACMTCGSMAAGLSWLHQLRHRVTLGRA